ncbi:FAD/NAD(P)-binding domain-containing protein [Dendrothele bispora CBS 962.96]|uniref:FAD/NAD(P)-binding domain-containing protein n=1 Tax=Dendrothele bispora (strain CBS 962.96) TaxID=1314807 RepID=A0A4S8MT81_DENBC|nr:FAD/NAD(P)-binding domain-containing protein [Dendrothele bispora CBS 962.96]
MATTTAPVGIDIAAVSGPIFIGYLLHWSLLGTLSAQLYIYYTAFPNDKTIVKCIVYFVYFLEICQTILVTYDGLRRYGSGFGNYNILTQIGLLWLSLPIMSAVVSCIGQMFFAYRIRILTGSRVIPVFITVLALISSVGGFLTGIYAGIDGRVDNLNNLRTSIAVITWDATSAFCDVFIAACMTFYLYRNRSAMQFGKTKSLLSKLIRLVIETGTATVAEAVLYRSPNDLPTKNYDFIIVGAGTAGNVIANRLSEDSSKKILVIEAGVDDANISNIEVPFFAGRNSQTAVDWNYTTVPQEGLFNRSIAVPRGYVLGGSSSINYMVYNRGSVDLWNRYAEITGDSGWSWDAMKTYWKRTSTLVPPTSNPFLPPPPAGNPTLSNGNGPVLVTRTNFPEEIHPRIINASKILEADPSQNGRFRYTDDVNTGNSLGFGYMLESNGHGQRCSSAVAYLRPAMNRGNLDVLIDTRVTKLLRKKHSNDHPIFNKVEVAQRVDGPRYVLHAKKEIILSAGAIGTPQILLLSGIGPRDELEAKGITVYVNSPDVGKKCFNHPLLPLRFTVNSNNTFDDVNRDPALQQMLLSQWQSNRTGLFANGPANMIGFMRLPDSFFNRTNKDPSSGHRSANMEMVFFNGYSGVPPPQGHYFTLTPVIVSPKSFGSVTLASAEEDTFTNPLIDFGLLSNDFDVSAMLQAIRDAETFISTPPWTNYIIAPYGEFANATTDEERVGFMRRNANTIQHPVGTARMGRETDKRAVTDSRLKVRGVKGIRVVDASVFPRIPECQPMAVLYALAERAAGIIKEDHGMGQ